MSTHSQKPPIKNSEGFWTGLWFCIGSFRKEMSDTETRFSNINSNNQRQQKPIRNDPVLKSVWLAFRGYNGLK